MEKGYFVIKNEEDGSHKLYKHFTGRVVITNYDPLILTDSERHALNNIANKKPKNFILIDIRPGYPGGDFPIFGGIKLRSLYGIMDFLAEKGIQPVWLEIKNGEDIPYYFISRSLDPTYFSASEAAYMNRVSDNKANLSGSARSAAISVFAFQAEYGTSPPTRSTR